MTRKFLFVLTCSLFSFGLACQSTTAPNAGANSANAVTNIDPQNMPPGLSGSPVPPSGNSTPGIPAANAAVPPKGATPTPGIPPNAGKPLPKGATPTPGIPDPETLKRQMNQPAANINSPNPPNSDASAAANGENGPRTVRKP
jgi:hypothetical protein